MVLKRLALCFGALLIACAVSAQEEDGNLAPKPKKKKRAQAQVEDVAVTGTIETKQIADRKNPQVKKAVYAVTDENGKVFIPATPEQVEAWNLAGLVGKEATVVGKGFRRKNKQGKEVIRLRKVTEVKAAGGDEPFPGEEPPMNEEPIEDPGVVPEM